jgi:hypothetical protein
MVGAVRRPGLTFEAVVLRPRSAGLLIILFAVYFLASAALFATDVGRQALVDQWENTAIAFGQPLDGERYAELQEWSEQAVPYAAGTALLRGPVAMMVLALAVFGWFSGVRRRQASYRQVLAVVAAASTILMLRQLIAAPLSYGRETMASATTLSRLMPMVDQASPAGRFLSLIDLFVVWWLIVVAIGVAVLYQERRRDVTMLLLGVYVAVAVVLTGVMAVLTVSN